MLPTAGAADDLLTAIRSLMDEAFAGDFDDDDWDHTIGGWHVVVEDDRRVVAHASVVPRIIEVNGQPFRSGYVEGVATLPARQRQGLGSVAMSRVAEIVRRDFELGALGTGAHEFYERLGWERWRGPTFVRRDSGPVRSQEDDDGVMVLRFGPTEHVDLTAAISCEERAGDDW